MERPQQFPVYGCGLTIAGNESSVRCYSAGWMMIPICSFSITMETVDATLFSGTQNINKLYHSSLQTEIRHRNFR